MVIMGCEDGDFVQKQRQCAADGFMNCSRKSCEESTSR